MRITRKELIISLAIAALSLIVHLTYYRYGVQNLVDLGVACVDSERILDGQVPGRDFFEPYGPGRFYLIALSFLAGGKSLLTFSTLCVILLALKDGMVYLIARHLLSRPWALFVAVFAIMVHGPMHKVFLMLAGGLVILGAFRVACNPGRRSAFLLGLGVVTAGFLRYDMGAAGLIIALTLLPLLAASRGPDRPHLLRIVLYFSLGAAVLFIPVMTYFWLAGVDFGVMVKQHAIRLYCLERANVDATELCKLPLSQNPEDRYFGFMLIPVAAAFLWTTVYAFVIWFKEKGDRSRAVMVIILLLMSLMLFNQVRLGVKFGRFSQVCPPLFILLALMLQRAFDAMGKVVSLNKIRWLLPASAGAFFCLCAAYIWTFQGYTSQDSFAVLHPKYKKYYMDHPRSRCYLKGYKGKIIHDVVKYLETVTVPGEPIYTGPACPLFHFLAHRPNPTPFTDFTFYYFNDKNQRLVIRCIERVKVEYIVNWLRILTGFKFESCAPTLADHFKFAYAKDHPFSPEGLIGHSFAILRRKR